MVRGAPAGALVEARHKRGGVHASKLSCLMGRAGWRVLELRWRHLLDDKVRVAQAGVFSRARPERGGAHVSELSCLVGLVEWHALARTRLFVCCAGARTAERRRYESEACGAPDGALNRAQRERGGAHASKLSCLLGRAGWRALAWRSLSIRRESGAGSGGTRVYAAAARDRRR